MNQRGIEMSFGWIFAIIVGAAILFLAIYGVSRLAGSETVTQNTELAKQLNIILSPLESGTEEAKVARIDFPQEVEIVNSCEATGFFGVQKISVNDIAGGIKRNNPGFNVSSQSRYLFSDAAVQGKSFVVLSKPFEMPFRIANIQIIWSEKQSYCFVNAPREIEEELQDLITGRNESKNIVLAGSLAECGNKSRRICFGNPSCDVDVSLDSKSVKNGRKTVNYEGNLIYAAIFSDPLVYECQVQRVMKRASELARIYISKSEAVSARGNGCSSAMQPLLAVYANFSLGVKNSAKLANIYQLSEELRRQNEGISSCKIF